MNHEELKRMDELTSWESDENSDLSPTQAADWVRRFGEELAALDRSWPCIGRRERFVMEKLVASGFRALANAVDRYADNHLPEQEEKQDSSDLPY